MATVSVEPTGRIERIVALLIAGNSICQPMALERVTRAEQLEKPGSQWHLW